MKNFPDPIAGYLVKVVHSLWSGQKTVNKWKELGGQEQDVCSNGFTSPQSALNWVEAIFSERVVSMRILVVTDAYPGRAWPDANPFIHAQLMQATELGVTAEVLCPTPYVPAWFARSTRVRKVAAADPFEAFDDIAVHRPRFPRPPGKWFRPCAAPAMAAFGRRAFVRQADQFRPDLIHAHMALPTGYAAARWAEARGVPLVLTLHGLDITRYPKQHACLRAQAEAAIAAAALVLCVSTYVREAAAMYTDETSKLSVHYTGVDTECFTFQQGARARIRGDLHIPAEVPVIGFIGRLEEAKGVLAVVEVLSRLAPTHPDLYAIFVGDGPALRMLRRRVAQLGLEIQVRFVPAQPHRAVPGFLSTLDVLMLPSCEEGFGAILLEAQAVGTPVVANRTGGIVEAVADGEGGLLVTSGDLDALSDAVADLVSGKVDRTTMGARGRAWVKTRYCAREQVRLLLNIYTDVVGGH